MAETEQADKPQPSAGDQTDSLPSRQTGGPPTGQAETPAGMSDAYTALLAAADSGLPDDLDDLVGPTFWPELPAVDVDVEWAELRDWVERLAERYPHLDHHVIPACWYRHNSHVEALAALRDHEKVSYAESSPATSPAQWHQVFALIETRLRDWTAHAGCMSTHREPPTRPRPPDPGEWAAWVAADKQRRRNRQNTPPPASP